jgi:uncharacterized membrane protein YjjP (DUF1212 family)
LNKTVLNERLKLLASWFNTVSAAFLATGVVAPMITIIYGVASTTLDPALVVASSLICMLVGVGLHLAARSALGELRE